MIGVGAIVFMPSRFDTFVFIYSGVQIGAFVLSFAPPKSLTLIYVAPISPTKLWKRRIIALLPMTIIATVVFLVVGALHTERVTLSAELCELILPFTGLIGISYALVINPSAFVRRSSQKQSILKVLASTVLFSFAP